MESSALCSYPKGEACQTQSEIDTVAGDLGKEFIPDVRRQKLLRMGCYAGMGLFRWHRYVFG